MTITIKGTIKPERVLTCLSTVPESAVRLAEAFIPSEKNGVTAPQLLPPLMPYWNFVLIIAGTNASIRQT